MDARAEALGIEPCPMCGSGDVRWRNRRPQDFLLTWMRSFVEWVASLVTFLSGSWRSRTVDATYYGHADPVRDDVLWEVREANTGHKTPRRLWRCRACRREGHVF